MMLKAQDTSVVKIHDSFYKLLMMLTHVYVLGSYKCRHVVNKKFTLQNKGYVQPMEIKL